MRAARGGAEHRVDEAAIAQARSGQSDLVARARGPQRIEHGAADRSFGEEPGVDGAGTARGGAGRRRQAVIAARPCGDLELAGRDIAREVARDLHRQIPIRDR